MMYVDKSHGSDRRVRLICEALLDEGARISQRAGYEKGDCDRRVQEKNNLEGLLFAVGAACLVYHFTLLIPSIPKRRRNPSGFRPCLRPAACAQALQDRKSTRLNSSH